MARVFTEYLLSLEPSGEPDAAAFEDVWRALRRLLRRELQRRGLWQSSPDFLGVYGHPSWFERAAPGAADALDELAADAYAHVFIDRLDNFREHARRKPNVEGLVVRAVRNFLHDAQKRRDPLGFRVFQRLRAAIDGARSRGRIYFAEGGEKLSNDTVLAFDPTAEPEHAHEAQPVFGEIVGRWNDALLPDLITARGEPRREVVARLEELVTALPDDGVELFVFKDLIDALKIDARARWAALLEDEGSEVEIDGTPDEGIGAATRWVEPDSAFEDRESFERLAECVSEGIERLDLRARSRRHLEIFWQFLYLYAIEGRHVGAREGLSAAAAEAALGGKLPSQRRLSKLLGIPRDRFPDLLATLGGVVEDCLPATSEPPGVSSRWGTAPAPALVPQKANAMSLRDLQDELRRRTTETLRRETDRPDDASPPRVGDVHLFPELDAAGVEWVLAESAPGGSGARFLALAADMFPLIGSGDVAVGGESTRVLRGRYGLWLGAEALESGERVGSVEAEVVERARERRRELAAGRLEVSAAAAEVDDDPEYLEWCGEIEAERSKLVAALGAEIVPFAPQTSVRARRKPSLISFPAAAMVLLAIGLGLMVGWLAGRGPVTDLEGEIAELLEEAESRNREFSKLSQQFDELTRKRSLSNLVPVALMLDQRGGPEREIELDPRAGGLYIELPLPLEEPEGAKYWVELVRETDDKVVLEEDDLFELKGFNSLSLVVPPAVLSEGTYELRLHRRGGGLAPIFSWTLGISFEEESDGS